MDRLDLFSLFGELFPKLATALVILGLLIAPRLVGAEIVAGGKEEGRRITAILESVVPDQGDHHALRSRRPATDEAHH